MLTLGVDIGSSCVKAALWDGRGFSFALGPAAWDFADAAPELADRLCAERGAKQAEIAFTVATGYGRKLYKNADKTVTEITCHAAGAVWLKPGTRTVLDIGGQDSKVISLGENGAVKDFLMNDKCAAGTGRFLQNMATLIGCPLDDFANIPPGTEPQKINSMCTVFAETEATSLMAQGIRPQNIALGLHQAIVRRTVTMLRRVGLAPPLVFAGGVAHNPCVRHLLGQSLGLSPGNGLLIPTEPDMNGALGAALWAARQES